MTLRSRGGPPARIAIIDDDVVLAELVQMLLADEGYETLVCSPPKDGRALVLREQPDLILLDVRFGEAEDGWRVFDHLALRRCARRIPVILCPGAYEFVLANAPALLPSDGIFTLPKPFDIDTLLRVIHTALSEYPPLLRLTARPSTGQVPGESRSRALTAREHEIAQLICRGYSNRAIAEALVITPGAAANHVAHILDKLGCTSRVQVPIWMNVRLTQGPAEENGLDRLLA